MNIRQLLFAFLLFLSLIGTGFAQETDPPADLPATGETSSETQQPADALPDSSVAEKLEGQVRDIGDTLNKSETAQEVSTSILEPIYKAAEFMAFSTFHWVAFMLMVAGVIAFLFQLVFTKFLLLFRGTLNIREIASDALGLLISVIGLVLTTQAATENSDFTQNPVMVLSAAGVGALLGLVFYWWGQRQEFDAARGADAKQQKASTDTRRTRM